MGVLNNPEPSQLMVKIVQGKQIFSNHSLEQYIQWHQGLQCLLDSNNKKLKPWVWEDRKFDRAYIALPNYPSDYELKIQGPGETFWIAWDVIRGYWAKRNRQLRMYDDMVIPKQNTLYELSDEEYRELIEIIC